jgi:hypothetical protein
MTNRDTIPYHGTSPSLNYLHNQNDADTVSTLLMKLFVEKNHSQSIKELTLNNKNMRYCPESRRSFHESLLNIPTIDEAVPSSLFNYVNHAYALSSREHNLRGRAWA